MATTGDCVVVVNININLVTDIGDCVALRRYSQCMLGGNVVEYKHLLWHYVKGTAIHSAGYELQQSIALTEQGRSDRTKHVNVGRSKRVDLNKRIGIRESEDLVEAS